MERGASGSHIHEPSPSRTHTLTSHAHEPDEKRSEVRSFGPVRRARKRTRRRRRRKRRRSFWKQGRPSTHLFLSVFVFVAVALFVSVTLFAIDGPSYHLLFSAFLFLLVFLAGPAAALVAAAFLCRGRVAATSLSLSCCSSLSLHRGSPSCFRGGSIPRSLACSSLSLSCCSPLSLYRGSLSLFRGSGIPLPSRRFQVHTVPRH